MNASVDARAAVPPIAPAGLEPAVVHRRSRLVNSTVVMAEDLRCEDSRRRTPEGFSPDFQICLPYRGLFVWHVRTDEVVADANQVLFVTGGEAFSLSQPRGRGYAELIITPCADTLAEMLHISDARLAFHPLFRRRSLRATSTLQRLRSEFLTMSASDGDPLHREESALTLLRRLRWNRVARNRQSGHGSSLDAPRSIWRRTSRTRSGSWMWPAPWGPRRRT